MYLTISMNSIARSQCCQSRRMSFHSSLCQSMTAVAVLSPSLFLTTPLYTVRDENLAAEALDGYLLSVYNI